MECMKPYSVDLRTKIVESVRSGVSKTETARRFGVNRSDLGIPLSTASTIFWRRSSE